MSRPRVVAVVSAIASSIAAFIVLSRLQLAGTLAGAVIVPTIGTLVGHWSNESLDHAGRWMRRRVKRGGATAAAEAGAAGTAGEPEKAASTDRPAGRRTLRGQSLLATCAALALAVSVYSVVVPGPVERVVVQERVVERTITVTTVADDPDARALSNASVTGKAGTAQAQPDGGEVGQGAASQDEATQAEASPAGTSAPGAGGTALDPSMSKDSPVPQGETADPTGPPEGGDGKVPTTVSEPAGQGSE